MFNRLLDKGQFVIVFSLMMSETAHLHKNVIYEYVAKDQFKDDSPSSSSIILEIDLFLLILFKRIAYKKYEIEKFVKNTIIRKKVQNSYYSNWLYNYLIV